MEFLLSHPANKTVVSTSQLLESLRTPGVKCPRAVCCQAETRVRMLIEHTCEPTFSSSQSPWQLWPSDKRQGSPWQTANPPDPPLQVCDSPHTSLRTKSNPRQAASLLPWMQHVGLNGRSTSDDRWASPLWKTLSEGSTSGSRRCKSTSSRASLSLRSCWNPFDLHLPIRRCSSMQCCRSQDPRRCLQDNFPPGANGRHPGSSSTCGWVG